MPAYDYQCPVCGNVQEETHGMSEDIKVYCRCGERMKRLISCPAAIHFKGSGFYETDYKKKEKRK